MSKRALLAAVGALCVLGIGGFAYAAIPSASGVINACYGASNGQLRVIDTAAGDTCRSNEVALSWNQNGQRGATGAAGPRGATGPQGPAGSRGATGPQGPAGARGATGQQGATGARGATGQAGAPGQNGATGSAGPRGATGAAGAPGGQGPKGATGPAGVSGYQLVSSAISNVPAGGTSFGAAFCPAGKKVVGGGWDTDASRDVFVISSTPNASGSAWLGSIQNNSTGTVQVVLTAACVSTS